MLFCNFQHFLKCFFSNSPLDPPIFAVVFFSFHPGLFVMDRMPGSQELSMILTVWLWPLWSKNGGRVVKFFGNCTIQKMAKSRYFVYHRFKIGFPILDKIPIGEAEVRISWYFMAMFMGISTTMCGFSVVSHQKSLGCVWICWINEGYHQPSQV